MVCRVLFSNCEVALDATSFFYSCDIVTLPIKSVKPLTLGMGI